MSANKYTFIYLSMIYYNMVPVPTYLPPVPGLKFMKLPFKRTILCTPFRYLRR